MSESFGATFSAKGGKSRISERNPYLSIYSERLDWFRLKNGYPKVYNASLKQNPKKIDWSWISLNQKLSENFIREFKDSVDWYWISINQRLSEEFIREFKDRVTWDWISRYQTLSENFIREFKDRVDWYWISANQTLSAKFIKEFNLK